MRRRLILLAPVLAGCGQPAQPAPDTGAAAVAMLLAVSDLTGGQQDCSATFIAPGVALTAAHCLDGAAPRFLYQCASVLVDPGACRAFPVVAHRQHPRYRKGSFAFDFALLRFGGATADTPISPVLTPAEDRLSAGAAVDLVGYGRNDRHLVYTRRTLGAALSGVTPFTIAYRGGPCDGDSGGPALYRGRVAGVISHGDPTCKKSGVSGRVSAVYDDFIVPFLAEPAPAAAPGCGACLSVALHRTHPCLMRAAREPALVACLDACSDDDCRARCVRGLGGSQLLQCLCRTGCAVGCGGSRMCAAS